MAGSGRRAAVRRTLTKSPKLHTFVNVCNPCGDGDVERTDTGGDPEWHAGREQEAVATREALLDAAEREFRGKGVAHTTLADVAEAAGLTRGAIYWHFRDKAELFEAMCERAAMPMEAMLGCAGGEPLRRPARHAARRWR